jgi:hypothetical protein
MAKPAYYKKASPHTKLSEHMVLQIRAAGERGEDARDVADLYGCAPSTVRKIWAGETFRHVGRPGMGMVERGVGGPQEAVATAGEIEESLKKTLALIEKEQAGVVGPVGELTAPQKRFRQMMGLEKDGGDEGNIP